uniref:EF-hand domain-containing protein n=2 Tax=Chaetoceros debilis TaxID=122233 RepID=A0A7S3QEP6_9STRA|eukprot:CAMPEP_0194083590 /NCGR_PEP_ID=MMETSP0149-20130528/9648_1 /TAXON_ID=122233 /ORGANISM="Chaetoceros debilis, Strain MM31A-1" /LENGTH=544 /DNA_ID=CAMNT_0038766025 /DNA_START=78 /DNA_END=1712 /DNA_ORIENTATION=-
MALRLASTRLMTSVARCAPLSSKVPSILLSNSRLASRNVAVQPIMVQKCFNATLSTNSKVVAPPMVYIAGEEMTHYCMNLIIEKWVTPYFDVSGWDHFDLSCKSRDESDDKVLFDAVDAGKKVGAIFKEPTITPSAIQVQEMKLSKAFGSPNGAMRRGWNGITISRDTIHIEGIELGYKNRVLFERHAVGGEYGAGYSTVGRGTLITNFIPSDGQDPIIVDKRVLTDEFGVAVVYNNPYDNVTDLAHYFFKRCLEAEVTPYIVTKKTVFKWQEGFWQSMKKVFDSDYKTQFEEAGLLKRSGGDLQHLISDAATMQLIRWTEGGFGMAAHNYDGDMLTDQIAQVHRSPGFITSNLIGKDDEGRIIKEYEASHGTVTDLWLDHLDGKETSMNPLGMVEALIGAMNHAALLELEADASKQDKFDEIMNYTETLRRAMHNTFRYGQGTRDMAGPTGFTTEAFIDKVAWRLGRYLSDQVENELPPVLEEPDRSYVRKGFDNIDMAKLHSEFDKYDKEGTGRVGFKDFTKMLVKMGIAPEKKSTDKEPDV